MKQAEIKELTTHENIKGPYKLPNNWTWHHLNEITKINPSKKELGQISNELEVSFIPMDAVNEAAGTITDLHIRKLGDVRKGYTYFKEHDIIFAKITPCMENGKCAIAKDLKNNIGFGSTEFHVIRPADIVLSAWIWHFVRQKYVRIMAATYFTGSVGHQRVPAEFLDRLLIPLPPLPVQKRIVAKIEQLFYKIDEITKLRKEVLDQTKALMPSTLYKIFSNTKKKGWVSRKLSEIAEHKTGIWGDEATSDSGYAILRSTNITDWQLKLREVAYRKIDLPPHKINGYSLENGDIIVTKSSGSAHLVGEAAIFQQLKDNISYLFSNFILRLRSRPSLVSPKFLHYYLMSPIGRMKFEEMHRTTSGLRNLKTKVYLAQSIPLPSISEQRHIVIHLDEVQKKSTMLQKHQQEINDDVEGLRESILHKAFRGEL